MKQELTLERARADHAHALTEITMAAKRLWEYPEAWIQIWLPQLTISKEYINENETWLALLNDEPAGFYSLKQYEGIWWLDHLWVRPGAMGQGLGGFLFRHALMRCRARGVSILRIESDPNAQGFYEKMGAVKVEECHTEVEGQSRILPIMEIHL